MAVDKSAEKLCVLDCLGGGRSVVTSNPFVIGSSPACGLRIPSQECPTALCVVHNRGSSFEVQVHARQQSLVDGFSGNSISIGLGEEHSLIADGQVLAFKTTPNSSVWLAQDQQVQWYVFNQESQGWSGPFDLDQLRSHVGSIQESSCENLLLIPLGMEQTGFFFRDLREILSLKPAPTVPSPSNTSQPSPEDLSEPINSEYGELTCPICWFKFDRGDAMNIAVHGSLRGDALLGEDAMQRFHATRFNDRGQALDAMGLATTDLACPHCRRKLPPGFIDQSHYIFSIVGAPSSGKSYYLSVLVKVLQSSLFQSFGISFRDADPSENVILTHMKTQLFSASSPQDAFLAKTELEGALYETLPRQGRKVRLPKPFVFKLSQPSSPDDGFSVVFYDNAGEHFEPTSNSADSPGAQHIAVASGIFFLFDPLHNTEFRHKLTGIADPQLNSQRLDQQDVILAESEVRIKSLLGLDSRDRIATPLAVMVGKCDTWLHLLGDEELLPAIQNGRVSHQNLKANSKRIRDLLLEICPAIVANAEAISSNVCYFAISPLGSSPVEFVDSEGHTRVGPDPKQIRPLFVDAPTLWVLSQVAPTLIPIEPGN